MSSDSSAPLVSSATPIRSDAMVGANLMTLEETLKINIPIKN